MRTFGDLAVDYRNRAKFDGWAWFENGQWRYSDLPRYGAVMDAIPAWVDGFAHDGSGEKWFHLPDPFQWDGQYFSHGDLYIEYDADEQKWYFHESPSIAHIPEPYGSAPQAFRAAMQWIKENSEYYCDECDEIQEDGCIHYSPCCASPVIAGTDCCSRCKEHTGAANV